MKKKLRLLVTTTCDRSCPMCCNKKYDLTSLPKVDTFAGYDEILLTGGEPMLYPNLVMDLIIRITEQSDAKLIMYTAKTDTPLMLILVLSLLDGLTITLHKQSDVKNFVKFVNLIHEKAPFLSCKSLRLNIFKGIELPSYRGIAFKNTRPKVSDWKIKNNLTWQKACPVPEGEVFMRL